ncbi:MAG: hypothetical protein DESF_00029 [Desulfovibrio sp.]
MSAGSLGYLRLRFMPECALRAPPPPRASRVSANLATPQGRLATPQRRLASLPKTSPPKGVPPFAVFLGLFHFSLLLDAFCMHFFAHPRRCFMLSAHCAARCTMPAVCSPTVLDSLFAPILSYVRWLRSVTLPFPFADPAATLCQKPRSRTKMPQGKMFCAAACSCRLFLCTVSLAERCNFCNDDHDASAG